MRSEAASSDTYDWETRLREQDLEAASLPSTMDSVTGEEVPTFIQDWVVTPGGTIPVKMITVANTYTGCFDE